MVNFNFGLGGSTNDDDKKDDAVVDPTGDTSAQDDSSQQDDSHGSQDDTQAQNDVQPAAEATENIEKTENTEPVIEEVTTEEKTETTNEPVFEEKAETSRQIAEETSSEEDPSPFVDSNDNDLITETQNESNETSTLESQSSEENWLNKNDTEKVSDENFAEISGEPAPLPQFGEAPAAPESKADEPVAEVPVAELSTENPPVSVEKSASIENSTPLSTENTTPEANPFPEAAVPVVEKVKPTTNKIVSPIIPEIPRKNEAQTEIEIDASAPEIPTFGQPEKTEPVVEEVVVPNFATETPANNDKDLFAPAEEIPSIDPLAPTAIATIGGSGTTQDDDNDDDEQNSIESADPVDTLEKFKNGVTTFVKDHNDKIKEYKKQITDLNKKIREEKNILKNKQQKSAKILEDLNTLVANFSTTSPIKKKVPKKINKEKVS